MTLSVDTVLLILAAVCFAAAVLNAKLGTFANWVPLGLLFWVLTAIV